MDKEPIEAQETIRMTFDELLELGIREFKKSLGLPSKIVEADSPRNHITDNDTKVTGDQPTGLITDKAEEK